MWCGEVAFLGKVHATLRQISDRIPTNITKFVENSSELLNCQIFRRNSVGIRMVKKCPSEFRRNPNGQKNISWNFVGNASDFYNGQIPPSEFCRNPNGQYGRRNIFVGKSSEFLTVKMSVGILSDISD